ncbi:hypothetical protein BC628DRAFT_1422872 [Trametes gibbosa]|nr:hypothetical protein BC628DRAFT_1422872 [Trametes gibbosa]
MATNVTPALQEPAQVVPIHPYAGSLTTGPQIAPVEFEMLDGHRPLSIGQVFEKRREVVCDLKAHDVGDLVGIGSEGVIKLRIAWPGYDDDMVPVSFRNKKGQPSRPSLLMNVARAYWLFLVRNTRAQEKREGVRCPEWSVRNVQENKCIPYRVCVLRLHHLGDDVFEGEVVYLPTRKIPCGREREPVDPEDENYHIVLHPPSGMRLYFAKS